MLFGSEFLWTQQPIFLVIPPDSYMGLLMLLSDSDTERTSCNTTLCGNAGSKTSNVQNALLPLLMSTPVRIHWKRGPKFQEKSPLQLLELFIKGNSYSKLKQMPPTIPAESTVQTDSFQVKCQNRSVSFFLCVCVYLWVHVCVCAENKMQELNSVSKVYWFLPPASFIPLRHFIDTVQMYNQYTGWWKPGWPFMALWPLHLWTLRVSDCCDCSILGYCLILIYSNPLISDILNFHLCFIYSCPTGV